MNINVDEVKYIARLAKLSFTEEETSKLVSEFQSILTHFESIDKADLSDVNLDFSKDELVSVLREDISTVFENKEKLFQNVKVMRDSSIQVPKILE